MEYEVRTTAVMVVPKGDSIFAEGAITVRIDDEAAGEFLVLGQEYDGHTHAVKIDSEEWPMLRDAIDKMHTQVR